MKSKAQQIFDLIEDHRTRREPLVLARIEEVLARPMPAAVGVDLASGGDCTSYHVISVDDQWHRTRPKKSYHRFLPQYRWIEPGTGPEPWRYDPWGYEVPVNSTVRISGSRYLRSRYLQDGKPAYGQWQQLGSVNEDIFDFKRIG